MTQDDRRAGWREWAKQAARELSKQPTELQPPQLTSSERALLYTREDLDGLVHLDSLPGQVPFLRGVRASMYRGRPWTLRQYAGFSTAGESNAFYRKCLQMGQRGLSVAFDLPTHRGYDSDHSRVTGDVGKAGVAVDSVRDMERLFEGIPLASTSVSMTMNGAALPILAMFVVAAERQGVAPDQLSGTLQNDILKEFMVRNTYIYPPRPSLRLSADIIEYCCRHAPRFNPVSISGYHMQEAGAPPHMELAFTLANGLQYVQAALERGLDIDDFAPRLSFFFGVGSDLLGEVAKLRAARMLWAELLTQRFAPKKEASLRLRMHCQTSGVSLAAQQPHNNLIRVAYQALAAVLGGTQSLHTNAFDEALALPSDFAATLARNTQLILQHETGVTDTVDPLGGSYAIEHLTASISARARKLIERVDADGGMLEAIVDGWPQREIAKEAVAKQADIEQGRQVIVGVNRFEEDEPQAVEVRRIDDTEVREHQVAELERLKLSRNRERVAFCLKALTAAAESGEGLMQPAIEAARAEATVGEISSALEQVFGRHEQAPVHVVGAYAAGMKEDAGLQALRERTGRFLARFGRRPRILVAKLGQDGHDRGARVTATAFADAGFDVDVGPLFQTPAEVAQQAVDNDVHWVGISSQAGGHARLVPELLRELAALGASDISVAVGGVIPDADAQQLRQAGVLAVFGPGTPLSAAIDELLTHLESSLDESAPQ